MPFWFLATVVAMTFLILAGATLVPRSPGRLSLVLTVTCGLWWAAGVMIRHSLDELDHKLLANALTWFGIIGVPLFWSLCVITYARGREREKPWQIGLILLTMTTLTALAVTNDWHRLFFNGIGDAEAGIYRPGLLYYLSIPMCYTPMAIAFFYGIGRIPGARGLHRWQLLALLAAALIPWCANVTYHITGLRIFGEDPTPFVFIATGGCILFAQVFGRLFVLPPIGRDAIFATLPDPVVILDDKGRIMEQNPAAARLTGIPHDQIGGRLVRPAELSALLDHGRLSDGASAEIAIAETGLVYELSCHSLLPWGRTDGRMIVLRDVTLRKAGETRLNALSADLQQQLEYNLALQERLREEASRDHLTGLHNRRHAYDVLPGLLRKHRQTAIVILDIDHFKSFNDRYGHDAGDFVLKSFAGLIAGEPGGQNRAFRWGGEEFLVALPDSGPAEALRLCAGWRTAFAAADTGFGQDMRPSFSAGIRIVGMEDAGLDEVIKAADLALYEAKRLGRDRAIVFEDHVFVSTDAA